MLNFTCLLLVCDMLTPNINVTTYREQEHVK